MSNFETLLTSVPDYMSSREFAKRTGRQHGNFLANVRTAVKQGTLSLKESYYHNVEGGNRFPEFRLRLSDFDKLSAKLTDDDMRAVRKYFRVQSGGVAIPELKSTVRPAEAVSLKLAAPATLKATPVIGAIGYMPDAPVLTMNSLEIAERTGKDHGHVMRDIRKMLSDLKIDESKFGSIYRDARNAWSNCFKLPRRETEILLTGYSIPLRAKVIDRWRELEAQVAQPVFKVPTTLHGALLLAAELEEQKQALVQQVEVQGLKIVEDAPKVNYYDEVRVAANTATIGSFAKVLNFGEKKLFKWLRDMRILMADNKPYQKHIDEGHFRVLDKTTTKDDGKVLTYTQTVLTGKGKTYVQKRLAKAGNPDLSEDAA